MKKLENLRIKTLEGKTTGNAVRWYGQASRMNEGKIPM
jgi:hypothetical protein